MSRSNRESSAESPRGHSAVLGPLAACLVAGVAPLAAGDVIFDNGALNPDQGIQAQQTNDPAFNTEIADDFLLSNAFPAWDVTGLRFTGGSDLYRFDAPQNWRVRLYDDTGAGPSSAAFYDAAVTATNATPIGRVFGNAGSVWGYDVLLDLPAVTLAPGSYFVSVQPIIPDVDASSPNHWYWATSQTQHGSVVHADSTAFGLPRWTVGLDFGLPVDTSFSLTGVGVPAPSAAIVLLGGFGLRGRRRA